MRIRVLPANVANVIAAGEVVERPASVVKELMENAVDAGANHVSVVISDAGRTLINVIDNGCGMSDEEAVVCFERHATSKIASAEDLMDIHTFGFRGEALASIAAVAEVSLKTCAEGEEVGCEVCVADSKVISQEACACAVGCNFAVRNLFYNVPGRRKFLKSDAIEFKHIVAEFTRVAMIRPEIGFTLKHNGKDVYSLKPALSQKFRIQDLLGTGVASDVIDISAESATVKISGFLGRPDAAKKGLGNQYFFVNGRYFRSSYLHKAVMKAYESFMAPGLTPSYFLFLQVDANEVDVNVSPRKTEVKFEDDSVIFQVLYAVVRENLGKSPFSAEIDFDTEGAPIIPAMGTSFEEFSAAFREPKVNVDPSYNPFDNDGFESEGPAVISPGLGGDLDWTGSGSKEHRGGFSQYVDKSENYGKLFDDRMLPSKSVIVLRDKYILTTVKSGLLVVNIHRANERILFERYLKAIEANVHVSQTALFPVNVTVGAENVLLFEENAELLSAVGFDIAVFGKDSVVINGVPDGYGIEQKAVETMVGELIEVLSLNAAALPHEMASSMAERLARIGASSQSPITSTLEAQRLIDLLFACSASEVTASGHKTMTIISLDDLDKKF